MKKTNNNFLVKCIIFFMFIAIGVVVVYSKFVDMKKEELAKEDFPTTTYDILVARDFENNYPSTVSDVLKQYNKYLQYIYNNELEGEDFELLVDKIRCMWSVQWLDINKREEHIANFLKEVESFREDGKVMSNFVVSDSLKANEFKTPEGEEGKTLTASYLYNEEGKSSKVYMRFYFLNEEGRWKILYYELMNDDINDSVSKDTSTKDSANKDDLTKS
ncbi:MAG: hypothetical protein E7265_08590 [Lachnospiraceae bacterium]|nr:hypothetical protein [Lachnospiraceae bacterium]